MKDETYVIYPAGNVYTILYAPSMEGSPVHLEGRLVRNEGAEVLDLTSVGAADPFQVPAHMWVRVWPEESSLKWAYLDSTWLKEQARENLSSQTLDHVLGKRIFVTSPPEVVQHFVLKHAADERAFGKIRVLRKVEGANWMAPATPAGAWEASQ